MNIINNVGLFATNVVPTHWNELYDNLFDFIYSSNDVKKVVVYFKAFNIHKNNNTYTINEIPFKILSENIDYELDKDFLMQPKKNYSQTIFKILKYATHIDKPNIKLLVGNSDIGIFDMVICYLDNGIEMVVDIANNLIMKKEDYFNLFKFKTINELNKLELYYIYQIVDNLDVTTGELFYFLLASKEMFKELNSKEQFKSFIEREGINPNNYALWGPGSDSMFINQSDVNQQFGDEQDEIDEFTKTLEPNSSHITYNRENESYIFKDDKVKGIRFFLLSDSFAKGEIKDELLSDKRYHNCHPNAYLIAHILDEYYDSVVIVGGMIKINEKDYFYHSWVEVNDSIVMDYNNNIIMNIDDYYKLYQASPISKTSFKEMKKIKDTTESYGLNLLFMTLNYFGKEIMEDLKRNETILK